MRPCTQPERDLLVFLEHQLVENGGLVSQIELSRVEVAIICRWTEARYISWARAEEDSRIPHTRSVRFSDAAWQDAHRLRREKAEREGRETLKN